MGLSRIKGRQMQASSPIKAKKLVQGRQLRRKIARLEAKGYKVTVTENEDKKIFHGIGNN